MKPNAYGKYMCPCCEYYTLTKPAGGTFLICNVCYWEDDQVQLDDPDYTGGVNVVSLNQARDNFKKFGAIEERFKQFVRAAQKDELKL